jgi:hypothetical protein
MYIEQFPRHFDAQRATLGDSSMLLWGTQNCAKLGISQ